MLIRSSCLTTTPRGCREDLVSPIWITLSQIPFSRPEQRTQIQQRICVGSDPSKPHHLFMFLHGDPIFLPSGFQPFSTTGYLTGVIHANRKCSSVFRIYLGRPLMFEIVRSGLMLVRRRRYDTILHKHPSFMFYEVNLRLPTILTADETPETEPAPCHDAPIPLSNQLSLFSESDPSAA